MKQMQSDCTNGYRLADLDSVIADLWFKRQRWIEQMKAYGKQTAITPKHVAHLERHIAKAEKARVDAINGIMGIRNAMKAYESDIG